MNAEQIHTLVAGWPDEARPEGLWYGPVRNTRFWYTRAEEPYESWLDAPYAAALHVESGLRWLAMHDYGIVPSVCYIRGADMDWTVADEMLDIEYPSGPTLLEAVSAAVMAVKGGG